MLNTEIRIEDYNYDLPADRIAQKPADVRDASRLLVYRDGLITDDKFSGIVNHIPAGSLLVFNDTRVVKARLIFAKPTGATIEIFCIEPLKPSADLQQAFQQRAGCTWSCLVGNSKRWKNEELRKKLPGKDSWLSARRLQDLGDGCFEIEFSWTPSFLHFSEVLDEVGLVPLPPYINRAPDEEDSARYQTIFAEKEGSVAAPTAGLHFTGEIIGDLLKKGCSEEKLTLHVGLGTFRPVSVPNIRDHVMHEEAFSVKLSTLKTLAGFSGKPVIAVGTTSARTLESLYWLGVKLLRGEKKPDPTRSQPGSHIPGKEMLSSSSLFILRQWEAYETDTAGLPSVPESIGALARYLGSSGITELHGRTSLLIIPGYRFRLVSHLVTNFHLPQSTLLLLIAAFAGEDWKKVYSHALSNSYRFLSYGDACLFFHAI